MCAVNTDTSKLSSMNPIARNRYSHPIGGGVGSGDGGEGEGAGGDVPNNRLAALYTLPILGPSEICVVRGKKGESPTHAIRYQSMKTPNQYTNKHMYCCSNSITSASITITTTTTTTTTATTTSTTTATTTAAATTTTTTTTTTTPPTPTILLRARIASTNEQDTLSCNNTG